MRTPLLENNTKSSCSNVALTWLSYLLLIAVFIFEADSLSGEETPVGPAAKSVLPRIVGSTMVCGLVMAGQPVCQFSCPSGQQVQCSWTSSCKIKQSCPSDSTLMENRKCASGLQNKCCSCRSPLNLRGGFISANGALTRAARTMHLKMSEEQPWNSEHVPESFVLGNDPGWSLPENSLPPGENYQRRSIAQLAFPFYVTKFEEFLNQDYMSASLEASPLEPASFEALGAPIESVTQGKYVLHKLLTGWFGGNPTKVYAAGPNRQSIKEIPTNREGIVIISNGKASSIFDILENSWWGKQWKSLVDSCKTGEPPLLLILAHQDESISYMKELKDYSHDLFIISHAAAGSGIIRNKALGVLKEKNFQSGIIIDDDVAFLDSSRITVNRGLMDIMGTTESAKNILEVMFDVLSGDKERAERWKGISFGVFQPQDFIAPFEHGSKRFQDETAFKMELDEDFPDVGISRTELTSGSQFESYRECIGLSRKAIGASSYSNSYIWMEADSPFAEAIAYGKMEQRLQYSLLEMRIGMKEYPIEGPGILTREYFNFFTTQMASHISSMRALNPEDPGGATRMAYRENDLALPSVTYSMLAIYQWCRLNVQIDSEEEPMDSELLWQVFNGLYNEKRPMSWALSYTSVAKELFPLNRHPFRGTYPAKLMSLYLETNLDFLENEILSGLMPDPPPKYEFEVGSEPYFNDQYEVVSEENNF